VGTLIGAALAAIAGLAVATTTVIGIVQAVKEEPSSKPGVVIQYGQR